MSGEWKHVLYTPDGYEGVAGCKVCGGFEGSLPRECPQRKMTPDEEEAVYDGELEFMLCGWWVRKK